MVQKIKFAGVTVEKYIKMFSLVLLDVILINISFLLSLYIHYEGNIPLDIIAGYGHVFLIVTILKIIIFNALRLYDSLWEYASIEELFKVLVAVIVGNLAGITFMKYMSYHLYAGIYLFIVILEIACVGGSRFSYRLLRRMKNHRVRLRKKTDNNVLIIGSGSTASLIATEMKNHPDQYGQVIGYIDDNEKKIGKTIAGLKVLGNRYDIYSMVKRYNVTEIIIAIPTADNAVKKEIITECRRTEAKLKIVPGILEIIDGHVKMNKIRDVEIEDLLGREQINLNVFEIASYIENKTVMVTGGGGSIGSELCRQIAKFQPKKLIILDIYENNAYDIQNELNNQYKEKLSLEVVIASVRDKIGIHKIIDELRPQVIFHAAAHKHVPLMENSPAEAIKNNVIGTLNVSETAHLLGVERFVLISTDKAVNPTNIMGASKRICEMIIQGLAKHSNTKFSAVRFGNVLGSNGSVIPLFKKQIKEGGPVTVTHREIIRYFMTIPEAVQLVIQAGAIAEGGEVFILDMGEPVKIYDLAKELIKLSGLKPNEDIPIEITGLRPGEKLYEELLMDEEGLIETRFKKIFIGNPSELDYAVLKKSLQQLMDIIISGNKNELIEMIRHIVPTYRRSDEVNGENNHTIESIEKYRRA